MKNEIARTCNCNPADVKCKNCKAWGYNNFKPMTDTGRSRCKTRKEDTYFNQFCRKFEVIVNEKSTER